jgi:hypothetical protein
LKVVCNIPTFFGHASKLHTSFTKFLGSPIGFSEEENANAIKFSTDCVVPHEVPKNLLGI